MKIIYCIALLFSLLHSEAIFALDFEKLFMPGEVIEGHKKIQDDCQQCHVRLQETTQKQLCLDCHESIQQDLLQQQGFHAKNKKAAESDCKVCHADHRGREANIVWLDKDRFDHQQTDYPLTGKHLQTECSRCHKKDEKFRAAPAECIQCHKEDDIHNNQLGEKCASCHNPKAWTGKQFDHDKTTFKLKLSHQQVACDLCHVGNQFKDTPDHCISCHAIKDVHRNRFGSECRDCHNEDKWDKTFFRHDRDTTYRLKGRHRSVSCHACHQPGAESGSHKKDKKHNRPCYSCHRLDDVHKGKNGEECGQCHNEKIWLESSFDHDAKTDFALTGAHKKTACQACHQNDTPDKKTSRLCYGCHQNRDVHRQQLGKTCNDCHNESSWSDNVRFDHELTRFPLIGQHTVAGCESCHPSSAFKDVGTACNDCHQQDDVHKKALGDECQRCHNPNDWLIWSFDHDETEFKLKGVHVDLHCDSCHVKPLDKNATQKKHCVDCHIQDDIHEGSFGPDCEHCHTQDNFSTIDLRSLRSFGR